MHTLKTKKGQTVTFCEDAEHTAKMHRGWVAGPFVKDEFGGPFVAGFEVKFCSYSAGEARAEWAEPEGGETFMLVLEGIHEIRFVIDGVEQTVKMSAPQSIAWDNQIPHTWRVIADSRVMVVRTKRDQKP